MSRDRRDITQWQDDLVRRQRNIVFPETVQNEGQFWRQILTGKRQLTLFQKIARAVFVTVMLATWALVFLMMISGLGKGNSLWPRVLNLLVSLGIGVAIILAFLWLIRWQIRRRGDVARQRK